MNPLDIVVCVLCVCRLCVACVSPVCRVCVVCVFLLPFQISQQYQVGIISDYKEVTLDEVLSFSVIYSIVYLCNVSSIIMINLADKYCPTL